MGKELARIIEDDKFISAAVEAHNKEESGAEFKANHKAYFKGKGCDIADEIGVTFVDDDSPRLRLTMKGNGASVGAELQSPDKGPSSDPKAVADFKRLSREAGNAITSDAMLDAAEEAMADATIRKNFKADPKAHLAQKGVRIPEEVKVDVSEKANPLFCWSWNVCGGWGFCCVTHWACMEI
ncbi:MAG: hypothetical protein ACYSWU_17685 [Planctomycetota bacterium]|jgi:hypothetical protein